MKRLLGGAAVFSLLMIAPALAATASTSVDVHATHFNASSSDPPCGTSVNGGILPPGYAHCVRPCVDIPDGKTVTAVRMFEQDSVDGRIPCTNGGDCRWAKWWSTPEVFGHTICGNFKNWSDDRDRKAILEVDYK